MIKALTERRFRLRWQSWLVVVGIGLAAYFVYHAINGSRGLRAAQQLTQDLEVARATLATLRAESEQLGRHVEALQGGALDPDLVDELARDTLSLADRRDVIILLEPGEMRP